MTFPPPALGGGADGAAGGGGVKWSASDDEWFQDSTGRGAACRAGGGAPPPVSLRNGSRSSADSPGEPMIGPPCRAPGFVASAGSWEPPRGAARAAGSAGGVCDVVTATSYSSMKILSPVLSGYGSFRGNTRSGSLMAMPLLPTPSTKNTPLMNRTVAWCRWTPTPCKTMSFSGARPIRPPFTVNTLRRAAPRLAAFALMTSKIRYMVLGPCSRAVSLL